MNGPPCYNWSFVMERYCGLLVPAVKSRKHPFTALSLRQLHITRLNDIRNRYNLHEVLQDLPADNVLSSHELVYRESNCEPGIQITNYLIVTMYLDPHSILRYPRLAQYVPATSLRRKLAAYFATVIPGFSVAFFLSILPDTMVRWGKVRIANGGDLIRTRVAQCGNQRERDASLIRVRDMIFLPDASLISLFFSMN